MLAPARIPVAAGKKMAKTLKKLYWMPSYSRKSGPRFSMNTSPADTQRPR